MPRFFSSAAKLKHEIQLEHEIQKAALETLVVIITENVDTKNIVSLLNAILDHKHFQEIYNQKQWKYEKVHPQLLKLCHEPGSSDAAKCIEEVSKLLQPHDDDAAHRGMCSRK